MTLIKKIFLVFIILILIYIFYPKQFDIVGGITGRLPEDKYRCLGFEFSRGGGNYPDAQSVIYCSGILIKK